MKTLFCGLLIILYHYDSVIASFMHGTMCRVCDTHDSSVGDDCYQTYNKRHEVCSHDFNNCLTRYTMLGHGVRITKSCVTNTTCINEWWLGSRNEDICKPENLHGGLAASLHLGETCSFCCRATSAHDPYCNDGDLPDPWEMVSFPDVTVPTTHMTSTLPPPTTTTSTTTQTTRKTTTTTARATETATTQVATTATTQSSTTIMVTGDPMRCSLCNLTRANSTCQDPSIICSGDTPLCMTSFYDNGLGDLRVIKGCGSVKDCQTLWWESTRLRDDCMSDTEDPFSWTGSKSGQCHYCCMTSDNSLFNWCNMDPWPTKPKNLVNMPAYIDALSQAHSTTYESQTTKPSKTSPITSINTTPSVVTDTTNGAAGTTQTTAGTNADTTQTDGPVDTTDVTVELTTDTTATSDAPDTTETTPQMKTDTTPTVDDTDSTMTTIETNTNTTQTYGATDTSENTAETNTDTTQTDRPVDTTDVTVELTTDTTATSDAPDTTETTPQMKTDTTPTVDDTDSTMTTIETNTNTTQTYGATDTSETTAETNTDTTQTNGPADISMTTTEHATLKSASPAQTTETTTTPPLPKVTRQCVQCGDVNTGVPCGALEILLGHSSPCPAGQEFCMNDIIQNGSGQSRTVFKRCVSLQECRDKWFDETSDNPKCTTYDPSTTVSFDLNCHFCCVSDGCNKPYKPYDYTLWKL